MSTTLRGSFRKVATLSVMKWAWDPGPKKTRHALDSPCALTKSTIAVANKASEETCVCMLMIGLSELEDSTGIAFADDDFSKWSSELCLFWHLRQDGKLQSITRWLARKQSKQNIAFLAASYRPSGDSFLNFSHEKIECSPWQWGQGCLAVEAENANWGRWVERSYEGLFSEIWGLPFAWQDLVSSNCARRCKKDLISSYVGFEISQLKSSHFSRWKVFNFPTIISTSRVSHLSTGSFKAARALRCFWTWSRRERTWKSFEINGRFNKAFTWLWRMIFRLSYRSLSSYQATL